MNALLSRMSVRVGFAVLIAVAAIVIGRNVFREPQELCMQTAAPGTVMTVRGQTVTSTYVPVVFSVAMGTSPITVETADGQIVAGSMKVYDARSPELSFEGAAPDDIRVDFCNFMSEWDGYTTEQNGVITAYQEKTSGIRASGFTLTREERDGELAPANAIVSPSGTYVAYITWDAEKNATVLGVAEVSGKNNVILAELTPEQGEMAPDEFSWSTSKTIAYTEVTPMTDGPDANGNAHEKTLYHIDAATHLRQGVHMDPVP